MSLELEDLIHLVYFKFRYFNGLTIDEANDKSSFVGPLEPKKLFILPILPQSYGKIFLGISCIKYMHKLVND